MSVHMSIPQISATDSPVVRWTVVGRKILHVTLDRPPANALGMPIIDGLNSAIDAAEEEDARVLVVSSARPEFFAAGADIKHMATVDAAQFAEYGVALRTVLDRIAAPDRVSIAAVDGLALGGGLELAIACTLRVAAQGARLGLPEVKLGLIPGSAGTQRLPRLIGRGRALDMMLTGRQVEASEAATIGLVDRLVPDGDATDAALALAAELRSGSSLAQQALIRTVDAAFDRTLADGIAYEAAQEQELFEHGEAREGIRAFVEKRPPAYS